MKLIKNILFKNQKKSQLYIAVIGAFLGFTFLVTAIHYLIRVNEFGTQAEILGSNTLIVQKKVSQLSTVKLNKPDFSEKEIDNLRKQTFVEKVEPIYNNSFGVSLQTDSELVPYFRSDVFVQTVNSEFLKMDQTEWDWSPENEFVPIVLPRDFLVMLNTFASAQGIPQVSDDLAKSIGFKFTLKNDEKKEFQNAKIIGFTNEVSAILVPEAFMTYGNENFPTATPSKVTQVMMSIKEGSFGEFEEFANKRGIEAKESSMIVGKLKSISGTLFGIVMFVSIIAVFLAGLVLIQYAQLIISKNQYEIATLLRIGYSPNLIVKVILKYFIGVFAIIGLISLTSFFLLKMIVDKLLAKGGIVIDSAPTYLSIITLITAIVCYTIASYYSAKKNVYE
jgi:ABC-type antimicrobial peptide transport system permease subunit